MSNSGHYNRKHALRMLATHPAKQKRLARGAAKLARKRERLAKRLARIGAAS